MVSLSRSSPNLQFVFCVAIFAIILAFRFLQLAFPLLITAAIFYYLYSLTPLAQRMAYAKEEKTKQQDLIKHLYRRIEESPYTEEAFRIRQKTESASMGVAGNMTKKRPKEFAGKSISKNYSKESFGKLMRKG